MCIDFFPLAGASGDVWIEFFLLAGAGQRAPKELAAEEFLGAVRMSMERVAP